MHRFVPLCYSEVKNATYCEEVTADILVLLNIFFFSFKYACVKKGDFSEECQLLTRKQHQAVNLIRMSLV